MLLYFYPVSQNHHPMNDNHRLLSLIQRMLCMSGLLITSSLYAQEESDSVITCTPFNGHHNKRPTWAIKGMLFPYFVGNNIGMAGTIGVEYEFLKNQSIGVDLFLDGSFGSHENAKDTAGVVHEVGNSRRSGASAIFISYRYYLGLQKLRERKGTLFYLSPYFRYGRSIDSNDPAYENDYIDKKERSRAVGFVLGSMFKTNESRRWYIDVNGGPFYKVKDIHTTYWEDHMVKEKDETVKRLGLRLGIYFAYYIY